MPNERLVSAGTGRAEVRGLVQVAGGMRVPGPVMGAERHWGGRTISEPRMLPRPATWQERVATLLRDAYRQTPAIPLGARPRQTSAR